MCSRYEMKARPGDLAERFRLQGEPPDLARPEVRPTDPAPIVVRAEDGARFARVARFGLNVTWNRAPVINARAETLQAKPTFRPLLLNRCLVPASAYFEWRQDGRARRRNRIALSDEGLMGFAGLFDSDRFVIITCAVAAGESPPPSKYRREPPGSSTRGSLAAAAALAQIHDRMPAILPPEAEELWLDPNTTSDALAALLAPYAGGIAAVEDKPKPRVQGDLFGGA